MLTDNLRMLRKSFNLTQQEVADILGIDRSTYTFYEVGKTKPTIDNLKKLCDVYNVSLGFLCGFEKNCPEMKLSNNEGRYSNNLEGLGEISKSEKFILMAFRSLSSERKKEFLNFVRNFMKD